MKATVSAITLLHAAFALARCDNGPCDDPAVLGLETSECQEYHIFTARGSTAPKPGHAGELIRQTCEGLGDCGYEEIDYPAKSGAAGAGAWCKSAHEGALNGQSQMKKYAEKCPDAKLIVVGFSQGGSVVLDMLGGGGDVDVFGCHQDLNEGLPRSEVPGSKVVAIASFGPTVRSAGKSYTIKGGEDFNGTAPRSEAGNAGLDTYAADNILREWCNAGDPICAKGSTPSSVENHLNYFFKYTEEGAQWIIKTAGGGDGGSGKNSTTSTGNTKPSSTPQPKAATSPTETPAPADNTSFGIPTMRMAGSGTWTLCGFVVMGSLFFLS